MLGELLFLEALTQVALGGFEGAFSAEVEGAGFVGEDVGAGVAEGFGVLVLEEEVF